MNTDRPIRYDGDEETTVPDFAVAAMVIIGFVGCALALRVANGRARPHRRPTRVPRGRRRARRAMMDL